MASTTHWGTEQVSEGKTYGYNRKKERVSLTLDERRHITGGAGDEGVVLPCC